MKRLLRLAMGTATSILVVAVLVAAVGLTYQGFEEARDSRLFPPPGKLVDVGGHRLHLFCTGSGSPTVVLEASSGNWSSTWERVQAGVGQFSRVCSYDRAGYAWSDPGPFPRTIEQITRELHALLANSGEKAPYVLVGHSIGGGVAQLYAHEHPAEVAGIVLVDGAPPSFALWEPEKQFLIRNSRTERIQALAARIGVVRLWLKLRPESLSFVPATKRHQVIALVSRSRYAEALASEDANITSGMERIEHLGSLGALPLVVIRHGHLNPGDLPGPPRAELEERWAVGQRELASLSSNSKIEVAEKSGHMIVWSEPQLVIDTINWLLNHTRTPSHPN